MAVLIGVQGSDPGCVRIPRGGWKGRPVVVLGRRDGLPMGLHPLVSFVARPVKHVRLATALLKASALMRSKSQARPRGWPCPSSALACSAGLLQQSCRPGTLKNAGPCTT